MESAVDKVAETSCVRELGRVLTIFVPTVIHINFSTVHSMEQRPITSSNFAEKSLTSPLPSPHQLNNYSKKCIYSEVYIYLKSIILQLTSEFHNRFRNT